MDMEVRRERESERASEQEEEIKVGCYSHYIMNEVRCHIFDGNLFILLCCTLELLEPNTLLNP